MKVLENRQRDKKNTSWEHYASSITDVPDVREYTYSIYTVYIHTRDVYDWELHLPLTIKYLINSEKASSYINKTILNEHTATSIYSKITALSLTIYFLLERKMARLAEIWNDTTYAYWKFEPMKMLISHYQ